MNRLVAFGCSNTIGQGLPDTYDSDRFNKPSWYAWPALVSKHFGCPVWNRGHGGASNKFILHRLLNTEFEKNDVVVIIWTAFCRSSFIHKNKVIRMLPSDINRKENTHPESNRLHSAYYYEYLDDDYNAWHDSMVQINLAKSHLDSLGLKNLHLTWDSSPYQNDRPKWNRVDLINKQFDPIDVAGDNDHPGVESQKLMSKFIIEKLKQIL